MEPENQEKSEVYCIGDYVLDAAQRELWLADRAVRSMADARTQAGEMWRPADDEQLEAYRVGAEASID